MERQATGFNARKWIVRFGAAASVAALLLLGSFFIYFGLGAYLFPRFPVDMYNAPFGINFGTVMMTIGVLLFLVDFVFRKKK